MKTILIIVEHGLSLAYFLYTDLARSMLEKGVRLVFLVQEELLPKLRQDFADTPNLFFEDMRESELVKYQKTHRRHFQELFDFLRQSSASPRIPLTYVDTARQRKIFEARGRWKKALQISQPAIYVLRRSSLARKAFLRFQMQMLKSNFYESIFDRYSPDLVLAGTAGWRIDRYLLNEARRRGIKTATFIIGWDNPSSHGLPGSEVDYVNVWSKVHEWELSAGLDWPLDRIHIGGMPLYDNYLSGKWEVSRQEYFQIHGLDPNKKLVAYVATALSISPNLHIIEALAEMISGNQLDVPTQLLIRLHPNHFKPVARYQAEGQAVQALMERFPGVHVVAPRSLAGNLPRYSGEDFEEKASMLAHCDVMVSIYSTMILEAALYGKPVVSACIDAPGGWKDFYWIPLSSVPSWPTAARVHRYGASRTSYTIQELKDTLNLYLKDPSVDSDGRKKLLEQELTYLKPGEATLHTRDYLLSLLGI